MNELTPVISGLEGLDVINSLSQTLSQAWSVHETELTKRHNALVYKDMECYRLKKETKREKNYYKQAYKMQLSKYNSLLELVRMCNENNLEAVLQAIEKM